MNEDDLNSQDSNFNKPIKKSTWRDILLGLCLAVLLFITLVATLYIGKAGIISIIDFILISLSTFLSVRFIRRGRPIVGKIILGVVIPMTLLLLLFGACFISLGGL